MKDNPIKRTLLYRAARKAALKMRTLGQGGKKETAPKELVSSYQEKLSCHSDSYRQWMREQEPALWQQWEQTLQSRKRDELPERSCLVIGYEELGGIRELSQIVEICTRNPHILLFAEKPKDLDERAVSYVENWFATEPTARLLYGAEDHRRGEERSFPWFKPCFSPDTLLGFFYLGSYFALDCTWAMQTRLAGYEDARRNLYDFVLRLLEPYYEKDRLPVYDRNYAEIACTDLVLYHRSHGADEKMPEGEGSQHVGEMSGEANPEFWGYEKQYLACKQDMISRICGAAEAYQTMYPDVWTVIPGMDKMAEDGAPLVSVVIPSKDHPELLKTCISSFVERTALPRLRERVEFIVVDNGSGEKNRKVMEDFLESAGILYQYLYRPMAFNFSAMCNMGVEQAKGTCVLLLNDDIEIIEKDWLRILLGQVQMPGTGAVGAKLWYSEGRKIQHVGVTNMSVGPSHKLSAFPDDRCYYYGHNTVSYNMIGVTAACLLIEKSVYRAMGGLDETMAVAYNDVDFCFTLTEAGFRNVIRNDAVLLHHESASRGIDRESAEKWQRLLEEKARLYRKHPAFWEYDPYYSRQLAGYATEYHVCYSHPYEYPLPAQVPERRENKHSFKKIRCSGVMLTIDHIKPRSRINLEEPAVLEAEGWCYMQGWDNCLFERFLILEAEQGDFYYQFSVKEQLRPDVVAALPGQKNIELSGFTCGIAEKDMIPGSYRVGMLYRSLCSGKCFYGRSSKRLRI